MNWFKGSIPEAISQAKAKAALFIVVVHDPVKDFEDSANFLSMLDDPEVSALCSSPNVIIKLENGSQSFKQFAEIYPVVIIPAIYFINSLTGLNEETTGGKDLTKEKVVECLQKANRKMGVKQLNEPSPSEVASPRGARVEAALQVLRESTSSEPETSNQPGGEKKESGKVTSLEERVARAKKLLAERQAKKMAEEEDKDKNSEMERRQLGKQMQEMKRRQEEEATLAAAAERRKDKEEEKLARERVRKQIEQDRAERAEKFNKEKEELRLKKEEQERARLAALAQKAEEEAAQRCSLARIQFRLPDGRSQTKQFSPDDKLADLYSFVLSDEVSVGFSNISLSTAYPNKQLDQESRSTTLRSLGLVPSATILVLPKSSSSSAMTRGGSDGGLWSLVFLLFTPITALWGIISGFLFPTPSTSANTASGPSSQRRNDGTYRRDGNIARLRNQSDDDEDNNTYNGNSTQQM